MRTLQHELGTIYVPGPTDRLDKMYDALARAEWWAADTETTGLNHFKADFRTRIVQVGTEDEAWILRPEWHLQAIVDATTRRDTWYHHWLFDALALEKIGVSFDAVAEQANCTDIVARLLDPRPIMKGGTGHKLEQLSVAHLGTTSKKDARTALHEAYGRKNKIKIDDIFARVPIDLEEYLLYAGQDVFLSARLARELSAQMDRRSQLWQFYDFEVPLSRRIGQMQRIGTAFDPEWARRVEGEYDELADLAEMELVEAWHVDQTAAYAHTSAKSLRKRFEDFGVKWTKFSEKTNTPSLDADVLKDLAQAKGDVGAFARCILQAKRNKHYGDYIRSMFNELGADGRIHPNVRPMQAATHRMSITNPPIQQFPRGDTRARGCLISDYDEVVLCADFAQVEFRIGAAVSRDPVMIAKIINGEDLHAVTATALFGPGFTKGQRQVAKPIGFGRLYLGGARGIYKQMIESDTTGEAPSFAATQRAIKAFDGMYRVYNRYALRLKDKVGNDNGRLVTATGRELIVDRSYAAANYMIQSTARDVFAAGINKLHKAGYGDMLRLVVHDEVVLSVPQEHAEEIGRDVERLMSTTFMGVPIATEWAIKGDRWDK